MKTQHHILEKNNKNETITPQNLEENIVWHAIRYTWVFYLLGALYLVGPVLGWVLIGVILWRFLMGAPICISLIHSIWIIGMLVMLIAVIIGHLNFNLPMSSMIKSIIGWAKGWALLAVFPLLALADIRPKIIVRASMHLCQQTLFILPLLIIAPLLNLPGYLYTSPLKFLASHAFFEVELYGINASDGLPRWRLFAPWGPALGLIGNMLLAFSLFEQNKKWRWIGITASVIMMLLSKSRMGMLCFLLIPIMTWGLNNLKRTAVLVAIAVSAPIAAALAVPALDAVENFTQKAHAARADSSRVRGALGRIAIERWKTEAPIWGHGIVEKGPHYVEYMPIGSHHSWLGLLFVKGMVGVVALALPMLASFISIMMQTLVSSHSRSPSPNGQILNDKPLNKKFARPTDLNWLALHILLLLSFYSLSENLEILAYLYWPALLVLGIAFVRKQH